jgi:hypothetical protein
MLIVNTSHYGVVLGEQQDLVSLLSKARRHSETAFHGLEGHAASPPDMRLAEAQSAEAFTGGIPTITMVCAGVPAIHLRYPWPARCAGKKQAERAGGKRLGNKLLTVK